MKLILSFVIFIISFCAFSQVNDAALIQLREDVKLAKTDSLKINALLALGELLYDRNFSNSMSKVDEALDLMNANKEGINQQQLAKAYVIKGVINRRKGDYTKALTYYFKAKDIYEKENDVWHISDVYHNMAIVYRYQKTHDKSIIFYKKSIAVKESLKDIHGIAAGYNMMGVSYRHLKKLDSAFICYNKARILFKLINSIDDVQRVNNNMVVLYSRTGDYEKAFSLAYENVNYAKKLNKVFSLCTTYYNISSTYKKMKKYEMSMRYADSCLIVAKKEGFKEKITSAYLRKSYLYSKLKDYKDAYENYRIFNKHSDSIFNIKKVKKIQELELTHKFNQEKREVALLAEAESYKKWLYMILFIITVLAGIIISFLIHKNHKNSSRILTERVEKERVQKELLNERVKTSEEEIKRLIADNSMRLEFKEELLSRIKNEILPEASEESKGKINSLTSELQMQIKTEGKFSDLQSRIEEVNEGFDTKLRELYPSLSKTEREICALLRLNLSIKEIMTIRNSSLDSVKSSRYRIRKKIGIKSGDELEQFIQNIV